MDTPSGTGDPGDDPGSTTPRTVQLTIELDLDAYEEFLSAYNDEDATLEELEALGADHLRVWGDLVWDALAARIAEDPSLVADLPWVTEIHQH